MRCCCQGHLLRDDLHWGPPPAPPLTPSPPPAARLHPPITSCTSASTPSAIPVTRASVLCQQQHLHRPGLRRYISAASVPVTFSAGSSTSTAIAPPTSPITFLLPPPSTYCHLHRHLCHHLLCDAPRRHRSPSQVRLVRAQHRRAQPWVPSPGALSVWRWDGEWPQTQTLITSHGCHDSWRRSQPGWLAGSLEGWGIRPLLRKIGTLPPRNGFQSLQRLRALPASVGPFALPPPPAPWLLCPHLSTAPQSYWSHPKHGATSGPLHRPSPLPASLFPSFLQRSLTPFSSLLRGTYPDPPFNTTLSIPSPHRDTRLFRFLFSHSTYNDSPTLSRGPSSEGLGPNFLSHPPSAAPGTDKLILRTTMQDARPGAPARPVCFRSPDLGGVWG